MNPFDLIHEIYNIYLTISSYVETAQANKEQCQRLIIRNFKTYYWLDFNKFCRNLLGEAIKRNEIS